MTLHNLTDVNGPETFSSAQVLLPEALECSLEHKLFVQKLKGFSASFSEFVSDVFTDLKFLLP